MAIGIEIPKVNPKLGCIGWSTRVQRVKGVHKATIKKIIADGAGLNKGDKFHCYLAEDKKGRPLILLYLDGKENPNFGEGQFHWATHLQKKRVRGTNLFTISKFVASGAVLELKESLYCYLATDEHNGRPIIVVYLDRKERDRDPSFAKVKEEKAPSGNR